MLLHGQDLVGIPAADLLHLALHAGSYAYNGYGAQPYGGLQDQQQTVRPSICCEQVGLVWQMFLQYV